MIPVVLTTKRLASGAKVRGGVSGWAKIERDLRNLLGDTSAAAVTTMLDYYAFPAEAPGMRSRPNTSLGDDLAHVEDQLAAHYDDARFFPYLSLHEFEALVLADAAALGELSGSPSVGSRLTRIVNQAGGAEQVDDDDPPSRRIRAEWAGYEKVLHGPLVPSQTGIERLCERCPHFSKWVTGLVALAP